MNPSVLFNPAFINAFQALENPASMLGVVVRDGVGLTGRVKQEWERSPDGGREQLTNELSAMVVWGFGVQYAKKIFDKVVGKAYPAVGLDIARLEKNNAQGLINTNFRKYLIESEASQKGILKVLERQDFYRGLNFARSATCLLVPTLLLAFGVPAFNHWLTNRTLKKRSEDPSQPVLNPTSPVSPLATNSNQLPLITSKPPAPVHTDVQSFTQPNSRPFQSFLGSDLATSSSQILPHFGGNPVGLLLNNLVKNERLSTVIFSDGTLVSGRVVTARNWPERAEIALREAGIVYFLFFAALQIGNRLDKFIQRFMPGKIPLVNFEEVKTLKDKLLGKPQAALREQWQASLKELGVESAEALKPLGEKLGKQAGPKDSLFQFQQKTIETIWDYVHHNKSGNLLLDSGIETGLIPTLKKGKAIIGNDMLQSINTGRLAELGGVIDQVVKQGEHFKAPSEMTSLFNKMLYGKTASFLTANVIAFAALAYALPKAIHWVSYRLTGTHDYPGLLGNDNSLAGLKKTIQRALGTNNGSPEFNPMQAKTHLASTTKNVFQSSSTSSLNPQTPAATKPLASFVNGSPQYYPAQAKTHLALVSPESQFL